MQVDFVLTAAGWALLDEASMVVDAVAQDMLKFFRPNLASAIEGSLRHILMNLQKSAV
jgi:DNA-binding MarR family transcriptional regulator